MDEIELMLRVVEPASYWRVLLEEQRRKEHKSSPPAVVQEPYFILKDGVLVLAWE